MAYSCNLSTCILLLLIVNLAATEAFANSSSLLETSKTQTDALLNTGWWDHVSSSCTSCACDLIGVQCNKAGRVISIDLTYKVNVSGDLGKLNYSSLPYLQKLDRGKGSREAYRTRLECIFNIFEYGPFFLKNYQIFPYSPP